MIKIFTAIMFCLGIMIFVAIIFYFIEKFLGITAIPKHQSNNITDIKKTDESLYNYELKNDPVLVNYALQNVKKKNYALTKRNILSEIYKIKDDENLLRLFEQYKKSNEIW